MICSSNVFFINNPDPKLRLTPDPKKKKNYNNFGSTTLVSRDIWFTIASGRGTTDEPAGSL
jgi:hypothetical protein